MHALTSEGHEACTYTLTGPEALTDEEVAGALGLPYTAVTPQERAETLAGAGVVPWVAEGLAELDAFYADGGAATPTPDVEAVLARRPRAFADG